MDIKWILQLAGVALGLLYLYLEYKANIWLWAVSMVMPIVHGYLYFTAGLYADSGMQVYYVVAAVYGWSRWRAGKRMDGDSKPITHTPVRRLPMLVAVFALAYALLAWILVTFTPSTVPYWDALTTALCVIGLWMLSEKWVEEWLVWLLADILTVGLYIYKGIPVTAGLYAVYSAMAVAGYLHWKKMAVPENAVPSRP